MPHLRTPKKRCLAKFYKYTETVVRQNRRTKQVGVLYRCYRDDNVDMHKHKEEGVTPSNKGKVCVLSEKAVLEYGRAEAHDVLLWYWLSYNEDSQTRKDKSDQ